MIDAYTGKHLFIAGHDAVAGAIDQAVRVGRLLDPVSIKWPGQRGAYCRECWWRESPIHTASFLHSIPFSRDCSNMLYSNKIFVKLLVVCHRVMVETLEPKFCALPTLRYNMFVGVGAAYHPRWRTCTATVAEGRRTRQCNSCVCVVWCWVSVFVCMCVRFVCALCGIECASSFVCTCVLFEFFCVCVGWRGFNNEVCSYVDGMFCNAIASLTTFSRVIALFFLCPPPTKENGKWI